MKRITRFGVLTLFATLLAATAFAQQTVNTTTLSSALSAPIYSQGASGSNVAAGPNNTFVVGSTSNIQVGYELFVDQEAMLVQAIPVSGTVSVQRAFDGTRIASHNSGATVYIGANSGLPGSPFQQVDPPVGSCTLTNEPWSLRINTNSGDVWACTNGQWMNVVDAYMLVPPTSCWYSTSGGTFTTPAAVTNIGIYANSYTGLTSGGATAPGTPVLQVATTNSGTATNTISCLVPVPSRANVGKGVYVLDATWLYGIQQAAVNSTQVAVEASGTLNGVVAFGQIALPTAAASETPSTVAQARWDSGTITLTPAKASFNASTTTAGGFYTQKITPGAPAQMTSDLTAYYVNLTVLCAATTATTINTPGVLIHYRYVTGL